MNAPKRTRFLHSPTPGTLLFEPGLTVNLTLLPHPRPVLGLLFCRHRDRGHFTWVNATAHWAVTGDYCRACFRVLRWERIY